MPAMIGGEHHFVIDPQRIELVEEVTQSVVERGELQAHLVAVGAVGVADIIGRRSAYRDQIGGRARAEPHLLDQPGGEAEHHPVEFGRGAQRFGVAGGALEAAGADRLARADAHGAIMRAAEIGLVERRLARGDPLDRGAVRALDRFGLGAAGIAREFLPVPPPKLIDLVATHHHRRAVLPRDRDDPRRRVRRLHPLAERRHEQMLVGDGVVGAGAAGDALILGAIDGLVGARGLQIGPAVGDDAGARGVHPGQDRRMARAGLGRGMALIARREHRAFQQPLEPAGEAVAIFGEQIGGELIDRDRHDQLGRRARRGRGGGRGFLREQRGRNQREQARESKSVLHRLFSFLAPVKGANGRRTCGA